MSDLTPPEIARPDADSSRMVQQSIARLHGRELELTEGFYGHLFAMLPDVRALFPDDMAEQRGRLLKALLSSINALHDTVHDPSGMEARLQALGEIHYYRGIQDDQYQYVGHALIRTIRDVVPGDWSTWLSSAWISVCSWMIQHMVVGAKRAREHAESGASDATFHAAQARYSGLMTAQTGAIPIQPAHPSEAFPQAAQAAQGGFGVQEYAATYPGAHAQAPYAHRQYGATAHPVTGPVDAQYTDAQYTDAQYGHGQYIAPHASTDHAAAGYGAATYGAARYTEARYAEAQYAEAQYAPGYATGYATGQYEGSGHHGGVTGYDTGAAYQGPAYGGQEYGGEGYGGQYGGQEYGGQYGGQEYGGQYGGQEYGGEGYGGQYGGQEYVTAQEYATAQEVGSDEAAVPEHAGTWVQYPQLAELGRQPVVAGAAQPLPVVTGPVVQPVPEQAVSLVSPGVTRPATPPEGQLTLAGATPASGTRASWFGAGPADDAVATVFPRRRRGAGLV